MQQAATSEDLDPNFIEGFIDSRKIAVIEGYKGINKENAWICYICLAVVIVILSFARFK